MKIITMLLISLIVTLLIFVFIGGLFWLFSDYETITRSIAFIAVYAAFYYTASFIFNLLRKMNDNINKEDEQ